MITDDELRRIEEVANKDVELGIIGTTSVKPQLVLRLVATLRAEREKENK